ncbi:hypothetical protein JNW90_16780 [Micromonospora sp. STR1s_5]|nr:hypothetical protein [Micromonospora sp. STR1s_5]
MASEGEAHPMPLKRRECEVGATHDAALRIPRRRQEWMMPNHDTKQVVGEGVEQLLCSGNLAARYLSFRPIGIEGPVSSRVEADDRNLVVLPDGFRINRDVPLVEPERVDKALDAIIGGDVVIAGHRHPRK